MKKIIATVLAMVMALALCTTAFAATTSVSEVKGTTTSLADSAKYHLRALNDNNSTWSYWTNATSTTMATKTTTEDGEATLTYIPAFYSYASNDYYVCDKDVPGAQRLFKNNTFVAYVVNANITDYLDAATAVSKGTGCNDYAKDGYAVGDYVYEVATTGGTFAVVDGKLVAYNASVTVDINGHDFSDGATVNYKANSTTPVSVICKTCKGSFDVVKQNELGAYAGNYVATGYKADKTNAVEKGYYILLDKTTGSNGGSTTTTTTSPKTFDAGIAMYVGMALTSVAGSAVVIGKKKEF